MDNIQKIAKQELEKNRDVFQSLKDYDEGKKEIDTGILKKIILDK